MDEDGAATWVHADKGLVQAAVFNATVEASQEEAFVSAGQNGAAIFLLVSVHKHFIVFGLKVSSQTDVGRR